MSAYPWLNHYPESVPHEIDADSYINLPDLLAEAVSKYSDRPAYINMGKSITFSVLDQMSTHFAAYLQKELGLKPGDKVAVQMPNILQTPVVIHAVLKAGLVVVNTNPLYTPHEMRHQFKDSEAVAIIILANFANKLEEIIHETAIKHVIISELGDLLGGLKGAFVNFAVKRIKKMVPKYSLSQAIPFKTALARGKQLRLDRPEIKNTDLGFLQYTGGTTGVSKGAMLSHRNLIANLLQVEAWLKPSSLINGQEIFIAALPLYHIFALTAHAFFSARVGACNVLVTNPRDMPGFVKELGKHRYTLITGVNTLFNGLLNTPGFAELDHSPVKVALAGGMALQRGVFDRWEQVTGLQIAEAYGLTETSPGLCINPLVGENRVGTIGMPLPSTEIVLLDDEGNPVGEGEKGELCCKGPQVFSGYWNRPDETEACFINGYFRTGDVATMDPDGYFRIVDRKKEMILVSGFNVYPNEVEEAVGMMPKVAEVGAIGVPDPKCTEVVKVYIVKKDPSLTEEEVREHCKKELTGYKRPKHIAFVDELPKSNVGKILRRIIRENDLKENKYE